MSSRRQTRLTALDLIGFLGASATPKQWLHCSESDINNLVEQVTDSNLKLSLPFGIGLHHAGLRDHDRRIVEELFVNQKIQILAATSTLAWGVNFPAHLVVVKGTEYYDGKTKRYIDFPITDVLQMMGRAGRPQYDNHGKAVVMVQDTKKAYYKRFLYEPFPVESYLLNVLPDHLNAEIVAGAVGSMQQALEYLTWTFFFRRLMQNPSFYGLQDVSAEAVNDHLSQLVSNAISSLVDNYCVYYDDEDEYTVHPTEYGQIASFYYLSHESIGQFIEQIKPDSTVEQLLEVLCNAKEFSLLPVRHNEDLLNAEMAKVMPLRVISGFDSPHTKTHLLVQAHLCHLSPSQLPMADYVTDTKSVLDNVPRILQAMIDLCAQRAWACAVLRCIQLVQMMCQRRWLRDCTLLQLPGLNSTLLSLFTCRDGSLINSLANLLYMLEQKSSNLDFTSVVQSCDLHPTEVTDLCSVLLKMPLLELRCEVVGGAEHDHSTQSIDFHNRQPIKIVPDEQYALMINFKIARLRQDHLAPLHRASSRSDKTMKSAYTPGFAKPKEEGWMAVLAIDIPSRSLLSGATDLLAIKRISSDQASNSMRPISLSFCLEKSLLDQLSVGSETTLTLYLMSDCYLGLDQQFSIKCDLSQEY
ncbi:activating signal cointegrator 1 complex subunit [Cichlidogyrus casuarinus]|uniref:Activating signal cointegrator 1 complex subunit n=1 Tax=Cichlidogyrus casuarinus TaxID=1844966 RepID=A0ABD2PXX6_9PLAT